MLKRLRYQLTILYILVALGLIALISTGANLLLGYYFQRQTDLALNYKMALAFRQYNLTPPLELLQAEQDYLGNDSPQLPVPTKTLYNANQAFRPGEGEEQDEGEGESHPVNPAPSQTEVEPEEHFAGIGDDAVVVEVTGSVDGVVGAIGHEELCLANGGRSEYNDCSNAQGSTQHDLHTPTTTCQVSLNSMN